MKKYIIISLICFLIPVFESGAKFENNINSLKQYDCPEWFRDAKFGIYLHWGAYLLKTEKIISIM